MNESFGELRLAVSVRRHEVHQAYPERPAASRLAVRDRGAGRLERGRHPGELSNRAVLRRGEERDLLAADGIPDRVALTELLKQSDQFDGDDVEKRD